MKTAIAMEALPQGFTYISDPRIILSINYATEDNFMGRRTQGYQDKVCILTNEAAQALIAVQDTLDTYEKGYRLRIFDAYRPTQAVADFNKWSREPNNPTIKKIYFPDLEKKELFEQGYIAKIQSTHSRGSTVDLTITVPSLTNPQNFEDLDMGTIIDFFGDKSHTNNPAISEQARINRNLLKTTMDQHGFENYEKEWWHYTLKNEPFPDTYFSFSVK